mmetsp:Transcript_36416/g.73434  ORF Transcript_36416/g.73434 Transcript_36416/m.73434 type:complete len:80 (-) Transcript_36416:432-671(-)
MVKLRASSKRPAAAERPRGMSGLEDALRAIPKCLATLADHPGRRKSKSNACVCSAACAPPGARSEDAPAPGECAAAASS